MSDKTGGLEFDGQDDFARLLAGDTEDLKSGFDPGEKVKGTVIAITNSSVLLDIGAKSEGIIDRSQLTEDDELKVREGDTVEAYFVGMQNGEIVLTSKMSSQDSSDEELYQAYESRIPVEGKVTGTNSAGLEVTIGNTRGFCPASQIDRRPVEEKSLYVGQVLTFMILEYDGNNLVLSRRQFQDEQQAEKREGLKENLREGDTVTGTVQRLMDFGVFVDLGGIDGLIPMRELSWDRVKDAAEVVKEGEQVKVKVLKLDWERERITLSLKEAGYNPWEDVESKFVPGKAYRGTVTRLTDFGAFVQLEPGLEGLLHISKIGGGRRLGHAREVLDEGQHVDVYIDHIDPEQRRISLTMDESHGADSGKHIVVGKTVKGTVDQVKPYGVFVQLTPKRSGLLHVSEIEAAGGNKSAMQADYPAGKELDVVITGIKDDKISLGLPDAEGNRPGDVRKLLDDQQQENSDFGSLDGMFEQLDF